MKFFAAIVLSLAMMTGCEGEESRRKDKDDRPANPGLNPINPGNNNGNPANPGNVNVGNNSPFGTWTVGQALPEGYSFFLFITAESLTIRQTCPGQVVNVTSPVVVKADTIEILVAAEDGQGECKVPLSKAVHKFTVSNNTLTLSDGADTASFVRAQ